MATSESETDSADGSSDSSTPSESSSSDDSESKKSVIKKKKGKKNHDRFNNGAINKFEEQITSMNALDIEMEKADEASHRNNFKDKGKDYKPENQS